MKIGHVGTRILHSLSGLNQRENAAQRPKDACEAKTKPPVEIYVNQAQILKTNYANSMFINEIKKSNAGSLTEFEAAAANSAEVLKKFGTKGVPLKYPRKDFVKSLNKILNGQTKEEKEKIYAKLKISKAAFDGGYDGILNLGNLDASNPVEKQVLDEGFKFLYRNEVKTGDKKTDELLNTVIKGMPEFINIIGKRQHPSHDYSVDIHSLMVLANILNDPNYQTLSDEGKFILKVTALLHDIGKDEFVPDPEHPFKSLELSKPIVKKYKLQEDTQERLLNSIKDHQWLQWYNVGNGTPEVAQAIADDYSSKEDYQMALIIARADLKATSHHINALYSGCLDEAPQKAMREAVNKKFED